MAHDRYNNKQPPSPNNDAPCIPIKHLRIFGTSVKSSFDENTTYLNADIKLDVFEIITYAAIVILHEQMQSLTIIFIIIIQSSSWKICSSIRSFIYVLGVIVQPTACIKKRNQNNSCHNHSHSTRHTIPIHLSQIFHSVPIKFGRMWGTICHHD